MCGTVTDNDCVASISKLKKENKNRFEQLTASCQCRTLGSHTYIVHTVVVIVGRWMSEQQTNVQNVLDFVLLFSLLCGTHRCVYGFRSKRQMIFACDWRQRRRVSYFNDRPRATGQWQLSTTICFRQNNLRFRFRERLYVPSTTKGQLNSSI